MRLQLVLPRSAGGNNNCGLGSGSCHGALAVSAVNMGEGQALRVNSGQFADRAKCSGGEIT